MYLALIVSECDSRVYVHHKSLHKTLRSGWQAIIKCVYDDYLELHEDDDLTDDPLYKELETIQAKLKTTCKKYIHYDISKFYDYSSDHLAEVEKIPVP